MVFPKPSQSRRVRGRQALDSPKRNRLRPSDGPSARTLQPFRSRRSRHEKPRYAAWIGRGCPRHREVLVWRAPILRDGANRSGGEANQVPHAPQAGFHSGRHRRGDTERGVEFNEFVVAKCSATAHCKFSNFLENALVNRISLRMCINPPQAFIFFPVSPWSLFGRGFCANFRFQIRTLPGRL